MAFSSSRTLPGQRYAWSSLDRFRVDLLRFGAGLCSVLLQKMSDQQRDVVGTLAQRGHLDRDHCEPVVEVFAELVAP